MKLKLPLFVLFIAFAACNSRIQTIANTKQPLATIAVVQLDVSETGDFKELSKIVKEAKRKGAELIIFPESSVFGWLNPAVFTESSTIPGQFSLKFSKIAIKYNVWVSAGLSERGPEIPTEPDEYEVYDSGILINPKGKIVLHHRKYNVLKNAFNPDKCPITSSDAGCSYLKGSLSDIKTVETPFGRTGILVCADAYTYDTTALSTLKQYKPQLLIVPWGICAASEAECGKVNFNATLYAVEAAKFLETAYVIGANATGKRVYGRYLPSVYCGTSGYATPKGMVGGQANTTDEIVYFNLPRIQ